MKRYTFMLCLWGVVFLLGCEPEAGVPGPAPAGGKTDTGWVSSDSFELGGVLQSTLSRELAGAYANLDTDTALQEQLIDTQVKFAKLPVLAGGYEINQLAYRVRTLEVTRTAQRVTLRYEAAVDMVKHGKVEELPKLEDLPARELEVPLPLDPVGLLDRFGDKCAGNLDGYTLREDNYYYYFDPKRDGCTVELHKAKLTIEQIYPRRIVYPEYDQLLKPLGEGAKGRGFRAALFPTRGDDDPASLHRHMMAMLEERLGLKGTDSADARSRRYEWARDGATMVIDLFDPLKNWDIESAFKAALGQYQLVHFAGHSEYGTRTLLTDQDRFRSDYQILMMWSCHSYAYYARQFFRAKAKLARDAGNGATDPDGFHLGDFVGTAPTPFFGDEDAGIRELLQGLMNGIAAVQRGEPKAAPSWQAITAAMNNTSSDRPYGAAGSRDNAWQP